MEKEEEGKNIQGHQLVFILCSNSNQLPVCREVLGWAPLSKDLRVQSSWKFQHLGLFCKAPGSSTMDFINWFSLSHNLLHILFLKTVRFPSTLENGDKPGLSLQTHYRLKAQVPAVVCWSWLALAHEHWSCTSFPTSTFSDNTLVDWNHHSGSTYTIEISKHYISGSFFPLREPVNIYQHTTEFK